METVTVATHSGTFHADEVFAIAVIKIFLKKEGKKLKVIRTRDASLIASSDFVVDVGEVYDPATNRFDHHQKGRAGVRENGIPYASFGLTWKHFGEKITVNKEIVPKIDQKLVSPIDAVDSGVSVSTSIFENVREYTVFNVLTAIGSFYGKDNQTKAFRRALQVATLVLRGEIKKAESKIEETRLVFEEISKQNEPEILILEKYLTWETPVSKSKNIKLVIFPDSFSTNWCLQTGRDNLDVFGNDRVSFPENWRGLSHQLLEEETGINGSVFCHAGGFYAVNKTKEGAIEMANKAISQAINIL